MFLLLYTSWADSVYGICFFYSFKLLREALVPHFARVHFDTVEPDITNSRYNEHVVPAPWHFVLSFAWTASFA